ncbi:MAG: YaiI/YqxD family protein [Clostridia bacterium]
MRILIDADGCPVVDIAIACARRYHIEVVLVCDTAHDFVRAFATTVTVSKGADSADFALVNRIAPGDIVITQDYGLAAMSLARKACVLHQDGMRYTDENMNALLMARHTARKIRNGGGRLKGPAKRTRGQDESFQEALEALLS